MNSKPILGHCSDHPKEAAVATEKMNGGPKRRFCRSCWDHYRRTKLGHSQISVLDLFERGKAQLNFTPVAEMRAARELAKPVRIAYE